MDTHYWKKTTVLMVVGIMFHAAFAGAAPPQISFVEPPTPENGASIDVTSVEIEVSITEPNLTDMIFNWDGTDYLLYDDSLVLMFNFDNVAALGENYSAAGDIVKDLSRWGNHGYLSDEALDPAKVPTWISYGKYGGAFDFTGNGQTSGQGGFGQSIRVPHSDSLNPYDGDFAIAVWILTRDDYDGDILRKGSTNTASTWYKIEHSPTEWSNRLYLNFNTDATDAAITSTQAYSDSEWHFMVAQRNGDQAELWIDGVLDLSAPVTGSISNTANLAVGSKDTQDDDFINSTLDEIRIYMRSFNQDEIIELYCSNLNKYDIDKWNLYVDQSSLSDETTYTYQASAINATSETASTEQRSLTVDLAGPPDVTLEAPSDGSILNNTDVTFTCSATDDIGLLDASLYIGSTPETVTFSGPTNTDDAQLYATDDSSTGEAEGPDTNAGTAVNINVDGSNPHAHAVIKFLNVFGDGAGQVPLGSTIISATLGINCTNPGNMMNLYRLTQNWNEDEVTWNNASSGELWADSGADGPISNAGFAIDGDCTSAGWRTMDITQFVQEWSDGAANRGIVLTDSGGTDGVDFDSSESANPPVLTITFGQSGMQLIETVAMSGTSDSVSFSTVNLQDQQEYAWNCLVRNTSLLESWAPVDFQLMLDTTYPDIPILVEPADGSTVAGLSPTLEVTVSDPQGDLLDVTFYGGRAGSTDEFTIVALPDTQKYVLDGAYPEIFTAQTQWIIDNKEALNIVFVTHEGDIVDTWNSIAEWDYANTSMSLLDVVIPYGVVPGDHDHAGENPDGSTQYYELYFPASRFESYPWWGAGFNNNTNNYQLLTIGRQDYIFFGMDFCPSQDELDWANLILTTYSDRKAVLTTHALLDTSAQYYGSSDFSRYPNGDPNPTGDTSFIWNDLIRNHENLQLVLCGHMHGEARRTDDNLAGKPVHQLLADYQGRPNGGNGWLRIMRFVPLENKIYVQTYSPWLDQYEIDADSQFTLDYTMNSFTVIGTNTGVASGSNTSVVWADLLDGTEYEWFVEVTDTALNTQVGPTWSFTAIENPYQATNPSPSHGATDIAIETDLGWQAGVGASRHDVYFGIDPDPRTQQAVNLDTNSYDPGSLNTSTTYYWAVDELDSGGGLLAAGATWSFTTASAPGQASGPNPTDDATDVAIDTVLNWTAGTDTTTHDVYFGENASSLPLLSEGQTETTFVPGSLEYATAYYWRIDEVGPGGTTTGSVWSFTTLPSPPPGQATNPVPSDGETQVNIDTNLSWTIGTGAVLHDVYLGTDPCSLPLVSAKQPVFFYDHPEPLEEGITYYWRIDEYNIDNVKTEGVLWSFTTVLPDPPEMAIPAAPIDEYGSAANVLDVEVGVSLMWFSGDRATSHDVYFGTSSDSLELKTNILQEAGTYIPETGQTSFTWDPVPDGDLAYESNYYWRIDEINPGGTTEGPIWNFTTESDIYPPVFIYPPDAVSITAYEATITWTTNEPSDSNVEYGLDTSYGSSVYDGALVKIHSVTLTGLQPGTTYYYKATSTDNAGNSASEAGFGPFTTDTLPPELPWSDDFESGDFAAGGWTVVATPASVDENAAYTGSYGAHLKKRGTIEKSISTAGYQAIHVKYARTTNNMNSTEFLFVDWFDGSGWHELEATHDTSWGTVDMVCGGAGADNNPNFKVRFRINGKAANVEAMIDDVEITGTPTAPDTTPPDTPTGLGATPDNSQVSLSWNDNTEPDLAGYNVYRSTMSGSGYTKINAELVLTSDYVDLTATNGTTYYYVVTAEDLSSNESGYSNEASATPVDTPPSAPTGLFATPGNSQVSLDWNNNSESDLDGYNVFRSTTSGSGYIKINTDLVSTSDYVDITAVNGTTYYYVVTAVDQTQNESAFSNEVSATPTDAPPSAPTGLAATPDDSQVSLDWNDNIESDLDGYNVYRSTTSGSGYTKINAALVTASDYVDTTVVNGTTYYYVVTAVDQGSNESGHSNEVSATPSSQQIVYVENITMGLIPTGKNTKGTADVQISVYQANATVVGDWYLGNTGTTADKLLESGATALTDAGGLAGVISVPDKAKSGEYFTFVVTDVILAGYVFDPGQGVTENSIIVP